MFTDSVAAYRMTIDWLNTSVDSRFTCHVFSTLEHRSRAMFFILWGR